MALEVTGRSPTENTQKRVRNETESLETKERPEKKGFGDHLPKSLVAIIFHL